MINDKKENVMVTVICTAFNHEKYLRQCLDGFVMQKTNFRFEVIVHDDASTDRSPQIIQEYAAKFPGLFIPILQKQNLYSRHLPRTPYVIPCIHGKYVSFCEGDDFWIDPLKLQKQVDMMEGHPECHLCVHRVQGCAEDGTEIDGSTYPYYAQDTGVIPTDQFLMSISRVGYPYQTSSYFVRAEDYIPYRLVPPEFSRIAPVGDVPMLLFLGNLGSVSYINDTMSCYRMNSIGSWNARNATVEKRVEHKKNMIKMIEAYNQFTSGKYSDIVSVYIKLMEYNIHYAKGEYRKMLHPDYKYWVQRYSAKRKLYIYLCALFPPLDRIYKKIRGRT